MMSGIETLKARVKAVNTANAAALEYHAKLLEVFRPLVGKKIYKADGTLLASVEKLLPKFPNSHGLHFYRSPSPYSLVYVAKTCEPIPPHSCTYYESVFYIGHTRDGVLHELCEEFVAKTDYTVEDVLAKRADFKVKKLAYDDAKSAMYPFGEYDL